MTEGFAWDDLRLVLAIARAGSLSGAARALGVTHSTVFRQLGAVERRVGVRLFERFRDGYTPTSAGESVAALAAGFADDVLALERRILGQDVRPSGTVRIATTDTIAALVMPHLAVLHTAHPQIRIELVVSNAMANLTRRDADVALRPTTDPPQTLIGRRIAGIAHAVYGARRRPSRQRGSMALEDHEWIGLDDALATTTIGRWLDDNIAVDRLTLRVDTLPALRDAAVAGMGLALLPCYVGDRAAGLVRVAARPLPEPRSALWLLTHDDLKRTARIRAVMDFLAAALASERALLEGKMQGA